MYESRAIGRYIATLGSGPELIPTDPKAHAKFEQAASIEYANFDPLASGLAYEQVFKPMLGGEADEKRVEELVVKLNGKLDAYEVILGKQKYLAGDVRAFEACCVESWVLMDLAHLQNVTLADLYHLPYGSMAFEKLGYGNLDSRPNVKR